MNGVEIEIFYDEREVWEIIAVTAVWKLFILSLSFRERDQIEGGMEMGMGMVSAIVLRIL
jgi:hypothetical protein